jgi:cobalt/nickel transport protein
MKKNLVLVVLIIILASVSLLVNSGAEFSGADGKAEEIISQVNPGYEPWFNPIWEPPSEEIESLLFALQAALGTGFICFFFGYGIGRKRAE